MATSPASVILLIVTDEAPSVLTRLPLPQEGLSDGLQLGQLQPHFLQVEGAAVLDLPHWERVHVHERDVHQLPGEKKNAGMWRFSHHDTPDLYITHRKDTVDTWCVCIAPKQSAATIPGIQDCAREVSEIFEDGCRVLQL